MSAESGEGEVEKRGQGSVVLKVSHVGLACLPLAVLEVMLVQFLLAHFLHL